MKKFSQKLTQLLQNILPSPFTIALILSLLSFFLALFFTNNSDKTFFEYSSDVFLFWEKGFWELLAFGMQMMLILVLGHVLALSSFFEKAINSLLMPIKTNSGAAATVAFIALTVSWINWGLGLIVGAIFARKVGEHAAKNEIKLNYPLIGAAGYSGLMFWHGGLSGSAPLKVAESNHFLVDITGQIPINETIFGTMNLWVTASILIIIPLVMFFSGKKEENESTLPTIQKAQPAEVSQIIQGAEKLDYKYAVSAFFGSLLIIMAVLKWNKSGGISVVNPNYINMILFGLGLIAHKNIASFTKAAGSAISGATGILLQFPIYAGIMGIMKYSELTTLFTDFFVEISTPQSLPVFTLISAGIVNVFVPSGGGQWAVQGPVIVEAAQQLAVPIPKIVMALSYGDQLTNMMQPFWALPLLGITGLKAKQIVPYTLLLMFVGGAVYSGFLWFF